MEFPGLGEHCSLSSCKQLDFLPMNCDACEKTYCNDHVAYDSHNCQSSYKKDVQVPVCPLCNKPIPVKRGEPPDIKVGEHIDQDCESGVAKEKRKDKSNRCAVKGCKKNELIPVICDCCRKNYCLRHRHPQDHECSTVNKTNPTTRQLRNVKTKKIESRRKPQQTPLSVLGRDLDRARRERSQNSNPTGPIQTTTGPIHTTYEQPLSEDQALALAIQASLSESSGDNKKAESSKPVTEDEEEDHALAQAIADSEKEARERQSQQNTNQQQDGNKSLCLIS